MTNATTVDAASGSTRTRRIRATLLAGAALAAIAVIGLADAAPAFAHDELLGSSPEAEQVLDTAPTEIRLDFSNDIVEVGTAVIVVDHHGEEIAVGEPVIAGPTVTATLPADLDGDYQVRWRAVSSDGHPIEGTIDFGVGADATGVWEEGAPHNGADAGTDAEETASTDAGAGAWPIVGAVFGGLAIIAVIVAVIVRSRRKAPGAE